MPKKKEEEVLQLRAENALLRKLVEDLRKQVEELVKQITIMQMQLKDSHESKAEQTQQTAALQGKLDELLFQLKNLNRKEYGSKNERHNPRQGPPPGVDSDSNDSSDTAGSDQEQNDDASERSARLKNKATKEKRPR